MNFVENTPIQEVFDPLLTAYQVRLMVKREDLNHPYVNGNKWWKLKYNLEAAVAERKKILLTFGGAWSNHVYATAAAANEQGMQSIGIIRGEEQLPLNPVLAFARECGMELNFISRQAYREKNQAAFIGELEKKYGDFYLIPEGGTNELAVKGCEEFGSRLREVPFESIVVPVGTGGTLAGIICAFKGQKDIVGIPVLKDSKFLEDEIKNLVERRSGRSFSNWRLLHGYDCGGYAKVDSNLRGFILNFQKLQGIPLDFVYTGKMVNAVFEEIKKGKFKKGTSILAIHTGGLASARLEEH